MAGEYDPAAFSWFSEPQAAPPAPPPEPLPTPGQDQFGPTMAAPKPQPQAAQPPVQAQPTAPQNPYAPDALFSGTPPAAEQPATPTAEPAQGRPYLERAYDIPGDIWDIAKEGVQTTINAPSKIAGTAENHFNELIPNMVKMGMPEEKAKEVVAKMQRNEGILDLASGPAQTFLSWAFGPVRSMASRPLEEKTGVPKEVFESGAGMLMGRPRVSKLTPRAPLSTRLHEAATENYTVAKSLPIEFKLDMVKDLADDVLTKLDNKGFLDTVADKTLKTVEKLREPSPSKATGSGPRTTADMNDIDKVRSALGKLSRERDSVGMRTENAAAASHAISYIDDFMSSIHSQPGYIASGGHLLPALMQEMKDARGNWAAYVRADILERTLEKAHRSAAASGSGANIENRLRQKFDSILSNRKTERLFNDAELSMMEEFVKGTSADNAKRLIGKTAPTGIVSAAGSAILGHAIAGKIGEYMLPAMGGISKLFADRGAKKSAQNIVETTAKRSPLYEEWARNSPVVPKANLKWLLGSPGRKEEEAQ